MKEPMDRASSFSGISRAELKQIWRDYRKSRNAALRQQLTVAYLPLVSTVARRVRARLPVVVEVADLEQVGAMGLARAIDKFNPKKNTRFSTFAGYYVRGAMLDHLRKTDWVPRLVRQRAAKLADARETLVQKLSREPSDAELAEQLGCTLKELQTLKTSAREVRQETESQLQPDPTRTVQRQDHRTESPEEEAQRADLKRVITQELDREERLLLILYYYEEMTMAEVGATLGISESRVSQVHKNVMERLQATMRGREAEICGTSE